MSAFDDPPPPDDIVMQLPLDSIFIGEKRKKKFDPNDAKNMQFKKNMDQAGMINPIDCRPVGDRYELVCGRRRFWAAKQLKWTHISAKIGNWADDELTFMTAAENALRQQLTPVQHIQVLQTLMAEYEKIWGKDPGRSIGGKARAATAYRDPKTKQFVANPVTLSKPGAIEDEDFTHEPANPTVGFAGSGINGEPEQAITQRVHEDVGNSITQTAAEAKIARTLTSEQLLVLGTCPKVTKKDLTKLCNIKDVEKRKLAIKWMCTGEDPAVAIEKATGNSQQTKELLEHSKEEQMSDEDWVESYCKKRRDQIQDPKHFDRSAILYRHTRTERAVLRAKCSKEVWAAHQEKSTSFTWMFSQLMYVDHPGSWSICGKCLGLNVEEPDCRDCWGTGFKVQVEWPQKKR